MPESSTSIQRIGVIGAGVMGRGVAQNLAQSGFDAVLVDNRPDQLDRAREEIANNLRFQKMFTKTEPAPESNPLDRIVFTARLSDIAAADFIIENIVEKWSLKEPLYREMDALCRPDVVFAANTSAIPITRIASATNRASQVVGIHFMNPVPMKNTVELIRGFHTSDQSLEIAVDVLKRMGKNHVSVNDAPGFISNRVLMLTINESVFLLQDQVADVESVDRVFRSCFGHKMGPLETADLIGLDTILYSLEALYNEFNDPKFRPCPLLRKLVDAGLHGRKTGRGFYEHPTV